MKCVDESRQFDSFVTSPGLTLHPVGFPSGPPDTWADIWLSSIDITYSAHRHTQTHTHSIYSEICIVLMLMRRCEQTRVKATASWIETLKRKVLVGTFSTFYLSASEFSRTHTQTTRLFQVSVQLAFFLVWNWIDSWNKNNQSDKCTMTKIVRR